jgi:hypothetical protein
VSLTPCGMTSSELGNLTSDLTPDFTGCGSGFQRTASSGEGDQLIPIYYVDMEHHSDQSSLLRLIFLVGHPNAPRKRRGCVVLSGCAWDSSTELPG